MILDRDDPRLVFISLDKATVPPTDLIKHIKNRYWAYDSERGLIFWKPSKKYPYPGTEQCNADKEITKRIISSLYPWAEVRFVPSVFYKINPRDWVS